MIFTVCSAPGDMLYVFSHDGIRHELRIKGRDAHTLINYFYDLFPDALLLSPYQYTLEILSRSQARRQDIYDELVKCKEAQKLDTDR